MSYAYGSKLKVCYWDFQRCQVIETDETEADIFSILFTFIYSFLLNL